MNILHFLAVAGLDWLSWSKNKAKWIKKWQGWDSTFDVTGRGQAATVICRDPEIWRFAAHAKTHWNISQNINYAVLYELYQEIMQRQGKPMPALSILGAKYGVHANTISSYINILVEVGVVSKQSWNYAIDKKRTRVMPLFHEEYK
jgi:DNA-binding transcriptional regulator YhcF (GntR family)